jgi:hypothetical protein
MKNRFFWVALLLLVAGGIAGYLLPDEPIAPHESKEPTAQTLSVTEPSEMPTNKTHASYSIPESAAAKTVKSENEDTGKKDNIYKMFQFDERDNLVLNESMRLNIEKLYALNTPEELDSKLQKLSTVLPPTAHRQLVRLIDYFDKYIMASKQIYPPDVAPANLENAFDQLEGLHSLRVMHFGSDVATVFFAAEEKLNRQLLEVVAQGGRWKDDNMD